MNAVLWLHHGALPFHITSAMAAGGLGECQPCDLHQKGGREGRTADRGAAAETHQSGLV